MLKSCVKGGKGSPFALNDCEFCGNGIFSVIFSNTLQFCLNPTLPAEWANLIMDFIVDQQIKILDENAGSVTDNLTIIAPIVSVKEMV